MKTTVNSPLLPTESATTLVCGALGMKNPGIYKPVAHDVNCAFCGRVIPAGEGALPVAFSNSFNDFTSLAAPESEHMCWACDVMKIQVFLQRFSKVVATREGVYNLGTFAALASFLVNPPEAPFAVYQSDSKQQHLAWRTPVTLNRDRIVIRVGETLHGIRRPAMLEGVAAMKRLASAINEWNKANKKKTFEITHIYANYSVKDDATNATVSDQVFEYLDSYPDDIASHEDFKFLMSLSHSEIWAVVRVIQSKIKVDDPPPLELMLDAEQAKKEIKSSVRQLAFV